MENDGAKQKRVLSTRISLRDNVVLTVGILVKHVPMLLRRQTTAWKLQWSVYVMHDTLLCSMTVEVVFPSVVKQ